MSATDTELAEAIAEVEAKTETVADVNTSLLKSIQDGIDALSKSSVPKNAEDKSSLDGEKKGDITKQGQTQATQEAASAAVTRSNKNGKTSVPANGAKATLAKGEVDEDEDQDENDEDQESEDGTELDADRDEDMGTDEDGKDSGRLTKKSQAAVTEDSLYKSLTQGDGADEYMQVVDASDAIAHLTDSLVKGIAAIAKQVADNQNETRRELAGMRKSIAASQSAEVTMLKSFGRLLESTEAIASTPASGSTPSGAVVIVSAAKEEPSTGIPQRSALSKSLRTAMQSGALDGQRGAGYLISLDTKGASAVWESMSEEDRKAIDSTQN